MLYKSGTELKEERKKMQFIFKLARPYALLIVSLISGKDFINDLKDASTKRTLRISQNDIGLSIDIVLPSILTILDVTMCNPFKEPFRPPESLPECQRSFANCTVIPLWCMPTGQL